MRHGLEAVLVAAALYLAVGLVPETGWATLTAQIRSAAPGWVGLTCLLLFGRWVVWTTRWRLGLEKRLPGSSWWHALGTILAAAAVNHLTPSFRVFGGLLRARYLGGPDRRRFSTVYGTVLFDQLATQTAIGVLTAVAFVVAAWRLGRLDQMLAGLAVVTAFALLVPVLVSRLRRRRLAATGEARSLDSLSERLGALWRRIQEVLRSLEVLLRDLRLLAGVTTLALVYVVFNWAAAWAASVALGRPLEPLTVFLALSLGTTAGALSGTPGGTLTTEAAMVTCYVLLGIDRQTAFAATLLYRGLHYLLVLALGLPALIGCELHHRRLKARRASSPAATQ